MLAEFNEAAPDCGPVAIVLHELATGDCEITSQVRILHQTHDLSGKLKRRIRKTPVLPMAAAFDEGIEKFKQTIREAVAESERA